MTDPFADSWTRIARAQVHARDFERISETYVVPDNYSHAIEGDDEATFQVLKLKFHSPPPSDLAVLAAEVFWHLRSALDSIGHGLALATKMPHPDKARFPFGPDDPKNPKRWDASKGIPPEIFTFMRLFEPYKGGNDALSALNTACNNTKHMLLLPTPVAAAGLLIKQLNVSGGQAWLLEYSPWNAEKNELSIAAVARGAKLNYDLKIICDVAFDQPEIFTGKPAHRVLNDLLGMTRGIVSAIEAEAYRLAIVT